MNQDFISIVSSAREALGYSGGSQEFGAEEAPRYELFHAASSISSQKVRVVLAHHDLPYVNRDMNMFVGQPCLPATCGCECWVASTMAERWSPTTPAAPRPRRMDATERSCRPWSTGRQAR